MNEEMDQDIKDMIDGFTEEAGELVRNAEADVLELEKDPNNQECIGRVFRVVHTIKGNAGMLGFSKLNGFAHESENLLSLIREGEKQIDKRISDLLLEIIDTIKAMLENLEQSEDMDVSDLISRIKAAGTGEEIEVDDKIRFLVAEDEPTQQMILKLMLEDYGECDVVSNGDQAFDKFRLNRYDIVFMDIEMPGNMNGLDAVKAIRSLELQRKVSQANEVTIVMVSRLDDANTIFEAFYKAGATSYLPKPVSAVRLEKLVKCRKQTRGKLV